MEEVNKQNTSVNAESDVVIEINADIYGPVMVQFRGNRI